MRRRLESVPLGEPHQEVDEGDWTAARQQGELYTYGLATCIGIAIYNTDSQVGMLGHLKTGSQGAQIERFTGMMHQARRLFPKRDPAVYAWVGGAVIIPESYAPILMPNRRLRASDYELITIINQDTRQRRERVLKVMDRLVRGANLTTDWLDHSGHAAVSLDLATGERTVELSLDHDERS